MKPEKGQPIGYHPLPGHPRNADGSIRLVFVYAEQDRPARAIAHESPPVSPRGRALTRGVQASLL